METYVACRLFLVFEYVFINVLFVFGWNGNVSK